MPAHISVIIGFLRTIHRDDGADGESVHELCRAYERLEAAVVAHRDARGDDRCWLDDVQLYRAIGTDVHLSDLALPNRETFLANCARYHARRSTDEVDESGLQGRWFTGVEAAEFLGLRSRVFALREGCAQIVAIAEAAGADLSSWTPWIAEQVYGNEAAPRPLAREVLQDAQREHFETMAKEAARLAAVPVTSSDLPSRMLDTTAELTPFGWRFQLQPGDDTARMFAPGQEVRLEHDYAEKAPGAPVDIQVGDTLVMPVGVSDGRVGHASYCRVKVDSIERDVVSVSYKIDGETQWRAVPHNEARRWQRIGREGE